MDPSLDNRAVTNQEYEAPPIHIYESKIQPTLYAKDPAIFFFGIESRVFDVLNIRCDLEIIRHLEAAKQLGGILIVKIRGKGVLIRLPPVET